MYSGTLFRVTRNSVPGYNSGKGKKSGGCGIATAPARYSRKIIFKRTILIQGLLSPKPDLWLYRFH